MKWKKQQKKIMGLCSDFYEEQVHRLSQRIKLLEEALRDIKEIVDDDIKDPDSNSFDEMLEIEHVIKQIPDL
jgi:hypothetical protein